MVSDQKMNTTQALDKIFEGEFRRRFLREIWFPIIFTVASLAGPLLQHGFTQKGLIGAGMGVLISLVIWAFSWVAIQRDIARRKSFIVTDKLDAVLETVGGHWAWCDTSQRFAVHFTDDPHADESEEPSSEDSEDDTK